MNLTTEEKAARYDEIHDWMLWLKRRVIKRRINRHHLRAFLDGLEKATDMEDIKNGV